jgi:hypothetical protein
MSAVEVDVIAKGGVKSKNIGRKAKCEGYFPHCSVVEARRSGYQTGLDTPVVHTGNDEYSTCLQQTRVS